MGFNSGFKGLKYPLYLSDCNQSCIFWTHFFFPKNTPVYNFVNIFPVEAELSHVDRRTGRRDEANIRFSQFLRPHLKTVISNMNRYFFRRMLLSVISCFVDRASLYNLVNKAKLVHNFS